jgi:UDP-N-acetyl-D-mannosaminuronate dehydrogenase
VIVGLSYKSNTSDIRESPSLALIEIMSNTKCEIFWFDPLFKKSLAIPEMVEGEEYDLAVVITIHNGLDYSEILGRAKQILDCTNSLEISEKVIQL